jgi:hypothetical protein
MTQLVVVRRASARGQRILGAGAQVDIRWLKPNRRLLLFWFSTHIVRAGNAEARPSGARNTQKNGVTFCSQLA